MRKKDAGFAEKLLPVLLSTGMVFGMVLLSGRFMEVFRTREQLNQIARAYMLEMETMGCLKSTAMDALRADLKQEGLTNVNLTGTTTSPAGYGERIELAIEGDLSVELHVAIPFLYETVQDWGIPIKINLYSTAKH